MKSRTFLFGALAALLSFGTSVSAQESFAQLVGRAPVGNVKAQGVLEVPYITWGGDVATFYANGGLATKRGSIFQELGLNLKLVAGDDFVGQVKRYMAGDTPFLRGTLRMIGMASEVVGSDPRTRPVVFLQLTWSQGDHMVGRAEIETLDDLKGKKVVLQQGGPHVGMLDDILKSARLGWSDIDVVWVKELTGDGGPASRFRADSSVDACMVISPDMIGLTGGLDAAGTGAEGTVKGAHVAVSTLNMNRSIADVYACRKDFYDSQRGLVEKFAAGYLKGCEDVAEMKRGYQSSGSSREYSAVLELTQKIYGSDVIPNAAEADGLISDCEFVFLSGNRLFFEEAGFLSGFETKQREALQLAVAQGYAKNRIDLLMHDLEFPQLTRLGGLTKTQLAEGGPEIGEGVETEGTLLSFTISFEPNQTKFPVRQYEAEFQRVVENASLYGNAVFAIRGHADPTRTLRDLVMAGLKKGIIKRTGTRGNYRYFVEGRPLDLNETSRIVELVQSGAFNGGENDPSRTMQAALNLSQRRAEEVRRTIVRYAESKQFRLNEKQLQAIGAGIIEPVIARPRDLGESKENMRVEFRLLRVKAESVSQSEFDF